MHTMSWEERTVARAKPIVDPKAEKGRERPSQLQEILQKIDYLDLTTEEEFEADVKKITANLDLSALSYEIMKIAQDSVDSRLSALFALVISQIKNLKDEVAELRKELQEGGGPRNRKVPRVQTTDMCFYFIDRDKIAHDVTAPSEENDGTRPISMIVAFDRVSRHRDFTESKTMTNQIRLVFIHLLRQYYAPGKEVDSWRTFSGCTYDYIWRTLTAAIRVKPEFEHMNLATLKTDDWNEIMQKIMTKLLMMGRPGGRAVIRQAKWRPLTEMEYKYDMGYMLHQCQVTLPEWLQPPPEETTPIFKRVYRGIPSMSLHQRQQRLSQQLTPFHLKREVGDEEEQEQVYEDGEEGEEEQEQDEELEDEHEEEQDEEEEGYEKTVEDDF
ncbi:unnamed protein product [Caenorhabditis auriculariae]|uniref:Uncharacterized protein n=1 Tax=Caenorhabditis auriculariae TaxID=2777116 RepID=A0A8S1H5T6_9PELO|nr:unnamed protein product [Caenorhabditis auriculariae]